MGGGLKYAQCVFFVHRCKNKYINAHIYFYLIMSDFYCIYAFFASELLLDMIEDY